MNFICLTDIDECQSSPCFHGDCTDHVNFYSCRCYAGYTGTQCQIGRVLFFILKLPFYISRHFVWTTFHIWSIVPDIDECASSPCLFGNCTDQVNRYVCNCVAGYTGYICDTGTCIYVFIFCVPKVSFSKCSSI